MSSTSPAINQLPNKGKEKVGEAPASILNMRKEMINQGAASAKNDKNKGKEIMMVEEPKSNNKRKSIMLGEPDHSSVHGLKNPHIGGEEGGEQNSSPSSKEPSPHLLFGHVINPPAKGNPNKKAPTSYNCGFCDKSFHSPQALGGHQNGHKWERHLKQGIQYVNMAMGRSSSLESPPSPTIPSCKPFNGNQGPSLNPMTMTMTQHHHNNNPMMIMMGNNGHQHDGPNYGTFQHGGITSLNAAGAFQHPEGAWFTPGFGFGIGFNNAGGLGSSGALDPGHGAFQHTELACMNPGIGTGNYETHQGGASGIEFVLLPARDYQNIGAQQVTRVEIDFGLVPKRDGEETQGEASRIDLTLKL